MRLVDTLAFFEPINPISFIGLPIGIKHYSKAFSLSTFILAFISIAVRPLIHSFPILLVILPLSRIALSVLVLHGSSALKFITEKLSFENALILHEDSITMSFIVDELSIVFAVITIDSLPSSIWHVIFPLTFILVPCFIEELAKSICHVIFQITFIITAI